MALEAQPDAVFGLIIGRQASARVVDVVQGAELGEDVLVVLAVRGVPEQGD